MSAEATELVLFVDNDAPLYRQKEAIFRALARKKDRHKYERARAPKAFAALTNVAAKKYVKEHGAPSDRWNRSLAETHAVLYEHPLADHALSGPIASLPRRRLVNGRLTDVTGTNLRTILGL